MTILTALDAPADVLDAQEQSFVATIREHGWFDTQVMAEDDLPGFCYTTGFWVTLNRPEIILFGLKFETAHDILWDMYRDFQSGKSLPLATRLSDVLGNHSVYLFEVAKGQYAEHLGWNRWFYGNDDFPCLQLVWPDAKDIFPWEAGFDQSLAVSQIDLSKDGWQFAVSNKV